jgi:hypothetical protein
MPPTKRKNRNETRAMRSRSATSVKPLFSQCVGILPDLNKISWK